MLALVLGASEWPEYPEFDAKASFKRSAHEIVEYLRGPSGLNLSRRSVKVFFDTFDDAPDIIRQMRSFISDHRREAEARDDPITDLLIYYIGHGGITSDSNAFFLAVRSTSEFDPIATSITAESIGVLIREGAAGLRTYLVLDCCFAASLTKVFMSSGPIAVAGLQLRDKLPPQGDIDAMNEGRWPEFGVGLLCASGSREPAKAPPVLFRNPARQHTLSTEEEEAQAAEFRRKEEEAQAAEFRRKEEEAQAAEFRRKEEDAREKAERQAEEARRLHAERQEAEALKQKEARRQSEILRAQRETKRLEVEKAAAARELEAGKNVDKKPETLGSVIGMMVIIVIIVVIATAIWYFSGGSWKTLAIGIGSGAIVSGLINVLRITIQSARSDRA
jgi:hypothetical protein